jgi:imidazolonepropionase-like amidohydrolase
MNRFITQFLVGLFALTTTTAIAGPEVPGAPQGKPIALVGGTVHPIAGPEIRDGIVLFAGGKITAVGRDVAIPEGAERIDVRGKHVYPGLIDSLTSLGLVEIPTVRGTVDEEESGTINPNVQAQVAFNPDSELIPVTRSNGVLAVLTAPHGSLLAGTSAVMQLDGWTWEEMTVRAPIGLHIHWPRMAPTHTWRLDDEGGGALSTRDKALARLRDALADARAYQRTMQAAGDQKAPASQNGSQAIASSQPPHDARWAALVPVLERKIPVIVHADEIQQLQSAIAWAAHENLRLIIAGGYDAPQCVDLLKKYDVSVIVTGTNRLPLRRDDPYDSAFTVPARLHAAGVKYCLAGLGRMGNVRNLPYHAAAAAAYGLPPDEALRSITLHAAEVLGVADRLGSLEAGKDATLIVTTGDPLEIATQVTRAFVQGRRVDLSDRQKRLWHKYQEKYRQSEGKKNAD